MYTVKITFIDHKDRHFFHFDSHKEAMQFFEAIQETLKQPTKSFCIFNNMLVNTTEILTIAVEKSENNLNSGVVSANNKHQND